jgi:hypothetical protein
MLIDDDKVLVFTAAGEFDAWQVKACLKANGVESELHGEALRNTHGLTIDGLGEVKLYVAKADAERAFEVLAKVESGALDLDQS